MKKRVLVLFAMIFCISIIAFAQVPLLIDISFDEEDFTGQAFNFYLNEKLSDSSYFTRSYGEEEVYFSLLVSTKPIDDSNNTYSYVITITRVFASNGQKEKTELYIMSGVEIFNYDNSEKESVILLNKVVTMLEEVNKALAAEGD